MRARITLFVFILMTAAAFAVRLYRIDAPVADWHSWRQADTAAVARNFRKTGFDILRPRYDDFSNIQSGKDNPEGWRMVEFPLYQSAGYALYRIYGGITLEMWLRLVSIGSWMVAGLVLLRLVRKYAGTLTGLISYGTFIFLPYGIYFSRTILPEPFAVALSMLSLLFLDVYATRRTKPNLVKNAAFLLSAVLGAAALLTKPTSAFVLFPAVYLLLKSAPVRIHVLLRTAVFAGLTLFPFWWWRIWIAQYPEGIPVYTWLLNSGNIRFRGAWFYWLFAERLGKLILGYWGTVPFAIGLMAYERRNLWFFRFFLFGAILYITVFASGNVQHDYYQILTLPAVSIFCGVGFKKLTDGSITGKLLGYASIAALAVFAFGFSWYTIRTYYWINRPEIVEAGRQADSMLPPDAKVIAPYNGDTTFLYQTNRRGWPIGFDIPAKIAAGATHYVTVSPTDSDTETAELARTYRVLVRNDRFAIIDLTKMHSE